MMKIEQWKPYPENKNYLISTSGNVKRLKHRKIVNRINTPYWRTYSEKNMAKTNNGYGYLSCRISSVGHYIHRLVAETYLPNSKNLPEINHKDGNKANNNIQNLEWITRSDNNYHAYRELGRKNKVWTHHSFKGEKNGSAKLSNKKIKLLRKNFNGDYTYYAKQHNVTTQTIYNIIHRKTWKHI